MVFGVKKSSPYFPLQIGIIFFWESYDSQNLLLTLPIQIITKIYDVINYLLLLALIFHISLIST
jgi:hypothetical protein